MESPPPSSDFDDDAFDPSAPFRGIVVCCTSIPANQRTDVALKVLELGGTHKYDLTPDVTHLIVGEYNTQKYKHVAKSRPDIRPMAIGWVDAVRNLWVQDDPIDYPLLEKRWTLKPFETGGGALTEAGDIGPTTKLLCCLSGFEDYEERCRIVDRIKTNGGDYTGSLDRTVTHLIVFKPTGKKYMAAKRWNLQIVAPQWVQDSIERGMSLDEAFYDPLLPQQEIGKGAWTKRDLGPKPRTKRPRDSAAGVYDARRKLRKTASMKLNSQRENMWGQILRQQPSAEPAVSDLAEVPTQPLPSDSMLRPHTEPASHVDSLAGSVTRDEHLFASCHFCILNFQTNRAAVLAEYISSRGGDVSETVPVDVAQCASTRHFVIVPQESSPHTLPPVPDGVHLVTEFFIERCVHGKRLFRPQDHVFGRPFPVFPIAGFQDLSICTSGFVDLALSQVERAVRQLGARYEERFSVQCSVLVCDSLASIRKGKLDIALIWDIPVVKAEWLWHCISQGKKMPTKDYFFPEVEARRTASTKAKQSKALNKSRSIADMRHDISITRHAGRRAQSMRISLPGPDTTAFDKSPVVAKEPPRPDSGHRQDSGSRNELGCTTDFDTAHTHQTGQDARGARESSRPVSSEGTAALAEKSTSDLNKAFAKRQPPPEDRQLVRVRSEVCDSEAGDDGDSSCVGDGDEAGIIVETKKTGDAAEAEKRRHQSERVENAAAERRALSHKLTTLLESTGALTNHDSAANLAANTGTSASHGNVAVLPPPPRRKRNIMGRAISNVSAASTESQESGPGGRALSRTHSAVIHRDDSPSEEDPNTKAPTATQLEYDDPEATKSKARLMSKMQGRSSLGTDGSHKGAAEDRITMGDVWLQQVPSGGRAATGRSMRRRQ